MHPDPTTSGGSPSLLLFPTRLERRRFLDQGGLRPGVALQELSGFGPVAAAARTAQLLAVLRPRRVLLLGIAGAYDIERHPIGSALEFSEVALDGVGVGEGRGFRGPPAIGFPQWPGRPVRGQPDDGGDEDLVGAVHDRLLLGAGGGEGLLLTTCAASAEVVIWGKKATCASSSS